MADELPVFDPAKIYLPRGSTLIALRGALRSHRPQATPGGGIWVEGSSADGTALSVDDNGVGGGSPGGDELPEFKPDKIYLLTQKTINEFENAARRYRARAVSEGGLVIESEGPSGIVVGAAQEE